MAYYRSRTHPTNSVELVSSLAMSRNAWCVAAELLISGIVEAEQEYAKAWQELKRTQGLHDDLGVARAVRRIGKAAKARAADLCYSRENSGWQKGRQLLDEAQSVVAAELAKAKQSKHQEALATLLLADGELNHGHRECGPRHEALASALKALELGRKLEMGPLEGDALIVAALCLNETESERALRFAEDAVAVFHRLGDKAGEARAWHMVGVSRFHGLLRWQGQRALEAALKLFREAKDSVGEALELFTIADLHECMSKYRKGLAAAGQSLDKFRKLNYGRGWEANAVRVRLSCLTGMEQCAQAQAIGQEALEELREHGENKAAADVQHGLVLSFMHEHRYQAALQSGEELLEYARTFDNPDYEANALMSLARIHSARKEFDQARMLYDEARLLSQNENDDIKEWLIMEAIIRMLHDMTQYDQAVAMIEEQRALCQRTKERHREGSTLLRLCLVWGGKEDPVSEDNAMAQQAAKDAQVIFAELGDKGGEASAWDKIAQSHIIFFDDKKMEPETALVCAEKGRALHQKKGDREREARMLQRVFCRIYSEWGKHGESIKASEEAVRIVRQKAPQDKSLLADCLSMLLRLRLEQIFGELGEEGPPPLKGKEADRAARKALKEAREAFTLGKEQEEKSVKGWLTWQMGSVEMRCAGSMEDAMEMAHKAQAIGVECHDTILQAQAALLEAEIEFHREDLKAAAQAAQRALAIAQSNSDDDTAMLVHQFLQQMEVSMEAARRNYRFDTREGKPGKEEELGQAKPRKPTQLMNIPQPMDPESIVKPGKLHGKRVDKESLMKIVAETAIANVGLGTIDYDTALIDTGMDSLHGVALRNQLQLLTGMLLPASIIYEFPSQRSIVSHLLQRSNLEYSEH